MKRCKKCITPETVPNIKFNSEGICSLCLSYDHIKEKGEENIKKIVEEAKKIKGKNKIYDAIIPVSGGRYSTYVLYYAVKILKLKVLAVSFDNDFVNEQAKENIKNSCKVLNTDYIIGKSKLKLPYFITQNFIKATASIGPFGIINNMCSACAFGQKALVYKIAIKNNIPLIIWGNSSNEATVERLTDISAPYRKKYKDFFKKPLNKYLNLNFLLANFLFFLLRLEFYVRGNRINDKIYKLKEKNIKEISFFDYVEWNREKIKKTIIEELGWKKDKNHVSTWRNDCKIHPVMNWAFYKLYGCTKDAFGYCNMINDNQMDRETALYQEEKMIEDIDKRTLDIMKNVLGLSHNIFEIFEKNSKR